MITALVLALFASPAPPASSGFARLVASSGLVPSPSHEHAQLLHATATELEATLEAVTGVVQAKVVVDLPAARPGAPGRGGAAIVVRYRGAPPLDAATVRRLAAAAIENLSPNDVEVVLSATPPEVQPMPPRLAPVVAALALLTLVLSLLLLRRSLSRSP